ncbi:MAG: sulfite exporter TauE/SafE family protein [Bacteroidales bacterium]|nr:sulfite exporter TauE/SafE family protein [Bacteroidales bacterium]
MSALVIILLILLCAGASFVQRVSGFGFGIFIMTALPYIMPSYGEATTLSGLLSAAQSFFVVIHIWRVIDWRRLLPILAAFLVVSFFAVQFVAQVNDVMLKHILGVVLIVMSLYFLIFSQRISIRPTVGMQLSMGALSGAMGGLCAMQGPPAVLYFVASETDKIKYLALTQAYFFIGNIAMTFFRAENGFLTATVGYSWLLAFGGIFIGNWLGGMVFDRISTHVLRLIIYSYMAVSGVVALLS